MTHLVDGWLAKSAPALPFRRANAVLPAPEAGLDLSRASVAITALEAWYRERGHPRLLIQVPAVGPGNVELDQFLGAAGFTVEAPVDVLVADTASVAEAGERSGDRFRVSLEDAAGSSVGRLPTVVIGFDDPSAPGFAAPTTTRSKDPDEDQVWRHRNRGYQAMLAAIPTAVLAPSVSVDGLVVANGFGVLERGWGGVFGMGTAASWRRRGVGGVLIGAMAVEARRRDADHLYLQVEVDNAPAQALYRGLGFSRSHGYHYRVRELV